jgi:hypothetical protein
VAMANLPIYSFSAHLYSSHVSFKIDFSHPPPPPFVLLPVCLPALHYTGVKKKNPEWKMFKSPGVMWSVGWSRQEFLVNLEILFVHFVPPPLNLRVVTLPAVHSTPPILTGISLCLLLQGEKGNMPG